ncbi:hypothetical protein C8R44DRAFT_982564 [Mycena epipterygia]|nr:hypothetical protein C8R44DRAFT_982564 [Mycena epipterygia]
MSAETFRLIIQIPSNPGAQVRLILTTTDKVIIDQAGNIIAVRFIPNIQTLASLGDTGSGRREQVLPKHASGSSKDVALPNNCNLPPRHRKEPYTLPPRVLPRVAITTQSAKEHIPSKFEPRRFLHRQPRKHDTKTDRFSEDIMKKKQRGTLGILKIIEY